MDLQPTAGDVVFRDRARSWLADNAPREPRPFDGAGMATFDRAWQARQHEGGFAGLTWPVAYGGQGLSLTEEIIWLEERARAGAPGVGAFFVAVNHAGPTLLACADADQRSFHLPRILSGEAIWCQGFSEPGAGSDLAALRTRGEVDGDALVVTGQKIWTTYAQHADFQELLVRTSSSGAKHDGITWVICDMRSPGIEVRPITAMDRSDHFCEVFYDEVRIPITNVVGEIDGGWRVAMANLGFERATSSNSDQLHLTHVVDALIALASDRPGPRGGTLLEDDDELRRRLATAKADVMALRAGTYAVISQVRRDAVPGPEGSMLRLASTLLAQRLYRLAMDVLSAEGLEVSDRRGRPWVIEYLLSYRETIAGGTKDVQRNIIAQRVLGLPR